MLDAGTSSWRRVPAFRAAPWRHAPASCAATWWLDAAAAVAAINYSCSLCSVQSSLDSHCWSSSIQRYPGFTPRVPAHTNTEVTAHVTLRSQRTHTHTHTHTARSQLTHTQQCHSVHTPRSQHTHTHTHTQVTAHAHTKVTAHSHTHQGHSTHTHTHTHTEQGHSTRTHQGQSAPIWDMAMGQALLCSLWSTSIAQCATMISDGSQPYGTWCVCCTSSAVM